MIRRKIYRFVRTKILQKERHGGKMGILQLRFIFYKYLWVYSCVRRKLEEDTAWLTGVPTEMVGVRLWQVQIAFAIICAANLLLTLVGFKVFRSIKQWGLAMLWNLGALACAIGPGQRAYGILNHGGAITFDICLRQVNWNTPWFKLLVVGGLLIAGFQAGFIMTCAKYRKAKRQNKPQYAEGQNKL